MSIEYKLLLKRILLLQVVYLVLRLLFVVFNFAFLDTASSNICMLFVHGVRFDMAAIIYTNVLFILMHLFCFGLFHNKVFQHLLFTLFLLCNTVFFAFNFIDLAYFPFSHKRSTMDALRIWTMGTDTGNNLTDMAIDFWKAPVFLISFVAILIIFYPKYKDIKYNYAGWKQIVLRLFLGIIICGLCFGIVRGSLSIKPMQVFKQHRLKQIQPMHLLC
ncbi:MAG: hypothetical protein IPO27_12665 [Bacteroidetes bacterium]|nr:hypothetical protein [Bacteroidota bacterium]